MQRAITDSAKSGSELAPAKMSKQFPHLNEIFTQSNEDLDLASKTSDISRT